MPANRYIRGDFPLREQKAGPIDQLTELIVNTVQQIERPHDKFPAVDLQRCQLLPRLIGEGASNLLHLAHQRIGSVSCDEFLQRRQRSLKIRFESAGHFGLGP